MRPVIIEPSGSIHDMRFAIESTVFSAGMTPSCVKCGNNAESISSFLKQALKSSSFVMLIGAMQPDGCGRAAAANALSLPMVKSKKAESYIIERCAALGEDPQKYLSCSMLPKGATILPGDSIIPACFCTVDDNVLILMDHNKDEELLERLGALLLSLGEIYSPPAKAAAAAAALPFEEEKIISYDIPEKKPPKPPVEQTELPAAADKSDITPKLLIACIIAAVLLIVTAIGIFIGGYLKDDEPVRASAGKVVYKPAASKPEPQEDEEVIIDDPYESSEPESEPPPVTTESSSAAPASSQQQAVSSEAQAQEVSSQSEQSQQSSSQAESSQPVVIWQAESSSEPAVSSAPESAPPPETAVSEPVSSEPEPQPQPEPEPEPEPQPEPEPEPVVEQQEPEIERYDDELPTAKRSVFDDMLSYTSGGGVKRMEAYDLVCRILQNETRGNLSPEALKAHAVATYSMIKYNNQKGIAPWVVLSSDVSQAVEDAVSEVLGVGVYYNGSFANAVYHSTSCGKTTSSQAVWGGELPYLTSVDSSFDKKSPSYKSSYTISSSSFAQKVESVYGIELDGDPEDWIVAKRDAPGGYVGTVELGGERYSQGGSYGDGKKLTGRSIREQLFKFDIRSHCFEVEYDDDEDEFVFTVYGYGHGVGMSQYGAHFMAQDGYNFVEILHHYYLDTEIY